ncbi:hypothetical protein HJG60_010027 [Phyllostomus discolor]|uniref:Uncharacterized protein n=1 Tax=Phyllostomus discolor TaxID=89673 RepID=A0A834EJV6_9CHIR|nr:hypothetical protein HJG60_010027 [Phyllostomus discolor]
MLLLKASYCISFCLTLPTCKMGPTPPTSLESPGFQHVTGSGTIAGHSAPLGSGVRHSDACLPGTQSWETCGGAGFEHPHIPGGAQPVLSRASTCTISSLGPESPRGRVPWALLGCPGEPGAAPRLVSRAVLRMVFSPVIRGPETNLALGRNAARGRARSPSLCGRPASSPSSEVRGLR